MILVTVTDGKQSAQLLEFERQNQITVDTLPGTKLRLKNTKIIDSYISLTNKSIEVLGGEGIGLKSRIVKIYQQFKRKKLKLNPLKKSTK